MVHIFSKKLLNVIAFTCTKERNYYVNCEICLQLKTNHRTAQKSCVAAYRKSGIQIQKWNGILNFSNQYSVADASLSNDIL